MVPCNQGDSAQSLAHRLVWLRAQGQSCSTRTTYASCLQRFVYWGTQVMGWRVQEVLPRLPHEGVNPLHIELFIAWAMGKYSYSTIDTTINALAAWHKAKDLEPSAYVRTSRVLDTLRAAKITLGPSGLPMGKTGMSRPMLRLLLGYLSELSRQDQSMRPIYQRDSTWLTIGYFGLLRRSEIIALRMADVTFHTDASGAPSHIDLLVQQSKTDRMGLGSSVLLAAKSNDNIHIYSTLQDWYTLRLRSGAHGEDPLFTQWDPDSFSLSSIPISNGQALAKRLKWYLTSLKVRYPTLEVNPHSYGMHSLRRGGVQAAWQAGVDIDSIKSHGRWRSTAINAYMQPTMAIRKKITSLM
jgi:integrase